MAGRGGDTEPQRPLSLYDNLRTGGISSGSLNSSGAVSVGNLTMVGERDRERNNRMASSLYSTPMSMDRNRSPSQANCLSTTVPQNIAATVISGRHTPTRNSLRHSRMIVLSRTGKVPRKYMPPVLHHHKLAKSLVALQTLIGVAVSTLAVWLIVWAPSLHFRDIPYWSGGPLLLSGVLGLILLCCCRKDFPGYPRACYVFSYKVVSIVVSVVAVVACFCACVFAVLHMVFLYPMNCEPANVLNAVCICRSIQDDSENPENVLNVTARTFKYPDLNCPEVRNILPILLIGSAAANGIGGILVAWYLYLHWSSRYEYIYSQVRTNDNRPIVISNKM